MAILRITILSILLCVTTGLTDANGQSGNVHGVITDQGDGSPVTGAIVRLTDADGKILTYKLTSAQGNYSLSYNKDLTGVQLSVLSMGYRKYTAPLESLASPHNISLIPEPVALREVTVNAPPLVKKGDTLVYNVSQFADIQDRSIGDVLKKMPGIEVQESGQINYMGKPINKFYIEGSDLLEGRYGLATQNVSHKDVKSVELMENHQPVRMLDDIEHSDQAAINIKLKEDAKHRWAGTVNGGAGFSPLLLDASVFAMRIAKKLQTMETMRGNNTGWNPASQNNKFYASIADKFLAGASDILPEYLFVGGSSAPIDDKRTRFNRSALFSSANSYKINDLYDLKANLIYSGDRLKFDRQSQTRYLDSAISDFFEAENVVTREHELSTNFLLYTNTAKIYLKNDLSLNLKWNSADSRITGTNTLFQNSETPAYTIANDLQLLKRYNDRILRVLFTNTLKRKPHNLSVSSDTGDHYQALEASAINSVLQLSYGWKLGYWNLNGVVGANYDYRALESDLTSVAAFTYPTVNDSRIERANLYFRPDIAYAKGRFKANLYADAQYSGYDYKNYAASEKMTHNFFIVSPSLDLYYKLSARIELTAKLRHSLMPPSLGIFYEGIVMSNHRYLTVGLPYFDTLKESSAQTSFRYRNPMAQFFGNLNVKYEKNKLTPSVDQLFIDGFILSAYTPHSRNNDILSVQGGTSKGFGSGKFLIGLDMSYVFVKAQSLRNSAMVPYESSAFTVTPRFKGSITRYLTTEYSLTYGRNELNVQDAGGTSYDNLKQRFSITVSPLKQIQLFTVFEHYYTYSKGNGEKHLGLLDAGAKWIMANRCELSVTATNLLDQKFYTFHSYGDLSERVNKYQIRPRNIILSVYFRF